MNAPSAHGCIGEISSDQYSAAVALHDSEYEKTNLTQLPDKISFNEKKLMSVRVCVDAPYTMHVQYVCGYHEGSVYCGILCEIASHADRVLY